VNAHAGRIDVDRVTARDISMSKRPEALACNLPSRNGRRGFLKAGVREAPALALGVSEEKTRCGGRIFGRQVSATVLSQFDRSSTRILVLSEIGDEMMDCGVATAPRCPNPEAWAGNRPSSQAGLSEVSAAGPGPRLHRPRGGKATTGSPRNARMLRMFWSPSCLLVRNDH